MKKLLFVFTMCLGTVFSVTTTQAATGDTCNNASTCGVVKDTDDKGNVIATRNLVCQHYCQIGGLSMAKKYCRQDALCPNGTESSEGQKICIDPETVPDCSKIKRP